MDPTGDLSPSIRLEDIPTGNGALRFPFMTTLQHMAAVKIASQLLTNKDIRQKIASSYSDQRFNAISSLTQPFTEIAEQVDKLPVPVRLISHLSYVSSRLTFEIFKWMLFQKRFDRSFKSQNYLHCIQWTSRGRINREKTTEFILSMENVNEDYRKNTTNYYCFNMTGEALLKQAFDNLQSQFTNVYEFDKTYILTIDDQIHSTKTFLGPEFRRITDCISEGALKRLWASFSLETRTKVLDNLKVYPNELDLFCFFLSQMDEEKQLNFFRSNSKENFLSAIFQDWLWQDFFLSAFLKIFPRMRPSCLQCVCIQMSCKIRHDFHNSKSKNIFITFLHNIKPFLGISSVGHNINFGKTLYHLFKDRNMDIINFIISLIPFEKKRDTLDSFLSSLWHSTDYENLDLLYLIVNQFFETPEEIQEHVLKKEFYLHFIHRLIRKGLLEKVEAFIEMFFCDPTKVDAMKSKILREYLKDGVNKIVTQRKYIALNRILSFCFSGNEQDCFEYRKTQIFHRLNPQAITFVVMREGGDLKIFEEFFRFCFGQEDGIAMGRNELLQDREILTKMSDHLLIFNNPFLIDAFLDWCFDSDIVGRDLFRNEWRDNSSYHNFHDIYRTCYVSENPKDLVENLKLPLEEFQTFKVFCNLMDWPVEDKTWLLVKNLVCEELDRRVGESVQYDSLADLSLMLSFYWENDSDSEYSTDCEWDLDNVF